MAFDIDENGNITCYQGDNGQLVINGLPTDRDYRLYFAIRDKNRNPIGSEIWVDTLRQPSRTIYISAALTNLLTVPKGKESEEYYYGVKLCSSALGLEDTLLLGNSEIGDVNTITVYPMKVEGLLNG